MRMFLTVIIACLIGLGTDSSYAAGLDPNLVGKTCRGTFDTGSGLENSRGAAYIRFYDKDGALAIEFKTNLGRQAYENPTAEIPASGAQEVEVAGVTSTASQTNVKFMSANLAYWTLTFRPEDGKLIGEVDPTRNPARRNWRIAAVSMFCEASAAATTGR